MNHITVRSDGKIFIDGKESNFFHHEFLPPELVAKYGIKSIRYIDDRIIIATQFVRTETGLSTTVNNYGFGGGYKDSGTRIVQSYQRMYGKDKGLFKYANTNSMHKYRSAGDLKVKGMSSFEMVDFVMDNQIKLMKIGIYRVENPKFTASKKGKLGRDWLHMDTGNEGNDHIRQVNP